jgi:hypothetical protein
MSARANIFPSNEGSAGPRISQTCTISLRCIRDVRKLCIGKCKLCSTGVDKQEVSQNCVIKAESVSMGVGCGGSSNCLGSWSLDLSIVTRRMERTIHQPYRCGLLTGIFEVGFTRMMEDHDLTARYLSSEERPLGNSELVLL